MTGDTEQSECTNMNCHGEAEYAYWMPELGQFSCVRNPEHEMLDDDDLSPYVCESCRDYMAGGPHWDEERFFRPEEKLVTDGGTERAPVKKREWIAGLLEEVPVVEWDRFVVGDRDGYQYVGVYGWIDRDDEYKDFVWTRFWPDNEFLEYTTSSDEYSEYLQVEWFGKDSLDEHNPCRRVEDAFDIENAIELHKDASIEEFATDSGGDRDV